MKQLKRVLLLTPSMSRGGAETQLLKLATFLKLNSWKVLIISLKPVNEFKEELSRAGLEVIFLQSWPVHAFSNLRSFYATVKRFKPDVVVAFMFIAIIFARLLKTSLKFKLLSTIRISVLPHKWVLPFNITCGMDDAIVYNSFAAKRNFECRRPRLMKGIVIHNAVTLPPLTIQLNNNHVKNTFTWVCIGHFRWNKDYLTLFKAIALIKGRNFRINIIGALNNEIWPSQIIDSYGIGERVNLLGFKQDTRTWLAKSDAFVLSSFSEGMPNAVLEAMSFGKPVLATDIDGNHELIKEACCGLLCEKQNEHDMAAKMLEIMEMTPAERGLLGKNGRAYLRAGFSEQKVMTQWMQLIDQLGN